MATPIRIIDEINSFMTHLPDDEQKKMEEGIYRVIGDYILNLKEHTKKLNSIVGLTNYDRPKDMTLIPKIYDLFVNNKVQQDIDLYEGIYYFMKNDIKEMKKYFKKCLKEKNDKVYYKLGCYFDIKGNTKNMEKYMLLAMENTNNNNAYNRLKEFYIRKKDEKLYELNTMKIILDSKEVVRVLKNKERSDFQDELLCQSYINLKEDEEIIKFMNNDNKNIIDMVEYYYNQSNKYEEILLITSKKNKKSLIKLLEFYKVNNNKKFEELLKENLDKKEVLDMCLDYYQGQQLQNVLIEYYEDNLRNVIKDEEYDMDVVYFYDKFLDVLDGELFEKYALLGYDNGFWQTGAVLGNFYMTKDIDISIYYLEETFKKCDNESLKGLLNLLLGKAYNIKGEYRKAFEYLIKADDTDDAENGEASREMMKMLEEGRFSINELVELRRLTNRLEVIFIEINRIEEIIEDESDEEEDFYSRYAYKDDYGKPKLTKNEMDNIVKEKYKDVKNTKEITSCIICMDEFANEDEVCLLKCDHIYHYDCISKWLIKDATCPVCRTSIKNEKIKEKKRKNIKKKRT